MLWSLQCGNGRADALSVPYGPDPSQTLDTCEPSGTGGHPAVLMIHGGGLVAGDKSGYGWLCRQAASKGIVAIAINYRLATGAVDHRWPAQIDDVRAAVAWVRDHAKDLAIDLGKLCVLGDSSGAQLAIDFAFNHPEQRPACVIDQYGPVDLSAWGPDENLMGRIGPAAIIQIRRDMSPLFLVAATDPPVLIVHGTDDTIVPFVQSEALRNALEAANVPVRLIAFRGGHSYSGLTDQARGDLMLMTLAFVDEATGRRKTDK